MSRLAAVVVAVLLASSSGRGLCFMPEAAAQPARDAHGCCKKGWTEGRAECCMASAADEDPARPANATPLHAPLPMPAAVHVPASVTRLGMAAAPGDRSHSPPPLPPLRI
jgi:hypothetical protein